MNFLRSCCAAVLMLTVSTAAWQSADGLRIVVISGEDGVNIIQQRTAVQPVVEVRDRNNLPVAGIVVTFGIVAAGGGAAAAGGGGAAVAGAATFGSGLTKIGVVTDAAGRAVAGGLEPLGNGAFSIQASATVQGQTVTASISQTNFATVADALAAGKTPAQIAEGSQAGSQSSSSQSQSQSQSQTQSQSTQSQTSNAGTQTQAASNAGSAGSAGGAGGGAGGAGGAVGGGAAAGGGGLGAAGMVVGAGALGVGGYFVAKEAGLIGPKCTAEEEAVLSRLDGLQSSVTCLINSRSAAQDAACERQFNTAFQQYLNGLDSWCTCAGPSSNALSAEDKALVRDAFNSFRSSGFNVGNIPACFR